MSIKTLQIHGILYNVNLSKHYPNNKTQITEKYYLIRITIAVLFTSTKLP